MDDEDRDEEGCRSWSRDASIAQIFVKMEGGGMQIFVKAGSAEVSVLAIFPRVVLIRGGTSARTCGEGGKKSVGLLILKPPMNGWRCPFGGVSMGGGATTGVRLAKGARTILGSAHVPA